ICEEVARDWRTETGNDVKLSYSTLRNHVMGGKTLSDFNAEKRLLENEEEEVVIGFSREMGDRGFPLSHRRLKEHVDEIMRARLGKEYPAEGVGRNWTARFVERHHLKL
ncbi:hypothetical protein FIBSPDRAFT_717134, partial [Athelia psychrophila]